MCLKDDGSKNKKKKNFKKFSIFYSAGKYKIETIGIAQYNEGGTFSEFYLPPISNENSIVSQ